MRSTNSQQFVGYCQAGSLFIERRLAVLMAGDRTTRLRPLRLDSTRLEWDRNGSRRLSPITHRGHDRSACCYCIFFNRFLAEAIAYLACVGLNAQQANQKSETTDGSCPLSCNVSSTIKEIARRNNKKPKKKKY